MNQDHKSLSFEFVMGLCDIPKVNKTVAIILLIVNIFVPGTL